MHIQSLSSSTRPHSPISQPSLQTAPQCAISRRTTTYTRIVASQLYTSSGSRPMETQMAGVAKLRTRDTSWSQADAQTVASSTYILAAIPMMEVRPFLSGLRTGTGPRQSARYPYIIILWLFAIRAFNSIFTFVNHIWCRSALRDDMVLAFAVEG